MKIEFTYSFLLGWPIFWRGPVKNFHYDLSFAGSQPSVWERCLGADEKLPKSIITPCHCNQKNNVIVLLLVRPDMILLGVFKWSLSTFSTGVIWALASDPTLTGSCPAILVDRKIILLLWTWGRKGKRGGKEEWNNCISHINGNHNVWCTKFKRKWLLQLDNYNYHVWRKKFKENSTKAW